MLTLFVLQRKHWTAIHKLSKTELIHEITNCYKYPKWFKVNDVEVVNDILVVKTCYFVLKNSLDVPPISTPVKLLRQKETKDSNESKNEMDDVENDKNLILEAMLHDQDADSQNEQALENRFSVEEMFSPNDDLSAKTIELTKETFEVIRKQLCFGKKKEKWQIIFRFRH